jgi:hypothetical protein
MGSGVPSTGCFAIFVSFFWSAKASAYQQQIAAAKNKHPLTIPAEDPIMRCIATNMSNARAIESGNNAHSARTVAKFNTRGLFWPPSTMR